MGHRRVPIPLLMFTEMGWLNFRHHDHGLSEQSCNCPSKQWLGRSSFSSTPDKCN